MKRSEINEILRDAQSFLDTHQFRLPQWSTWSAANWKKHRTACEEIFKSQLGWDITDFGSGDYETRGLLLFTIRNGVPGSGGKTYAEKVMIVEVDQETPTHFHFQKTEDIINRGGGNLVLQLWNSDAREGKARTKVNVSIDGLRRTVPAGGLISLAPGESICLERGLYHRFYGEKKRVLVGEVSQVNDDHSDNRFFETIGRFPSIVEDETPWRLLVSDYGTL
ncbi:MAG: D-lyxose/D-mannose family sugar isomerase [bacterium]